MLSDKYSSIYEWRQPPQQGQFNVLRILEIAGDEPRHNSRTFATLEEAKEWAEVFGRIDYIDVVDPSKCLNI